MITKTAYTAKIAGLTAMQLRAEDARNRYRLDAAPNRENTMRANVTAAAIAVTA